MMTIDQFCDKHGACKEGREWAAANCYSMRDVWLTAPDAWFEWVAFRAKILYTGYVVSFADWVLDQVKHLEPTDEGPQTLTIAVELPRLKRMREGLLDSEGGLAADTGREFARVMRVLLTSPSDADRGKEIRRILALQVAWLRENVKPNFDL